MQILDPMSGTLIEVENNVRAGDHMRFPKKFEFVPYRSSFPDSPPVNFHEAIVIENDGHLELKWIGPGLIKPISDVQ